MNENLRVNIKTSNCEKRDHKFKARANALRGTFCFSREGMGANHVASS